MSILKGVWLFFFYAPLASLFYLQFKQNQTGLSSFSLLGSRSDKISLSAWPELCWNSCLRLFNTVYMSLANVHDSRDGVPQPQAPLIWDVQAQGFCWSQSLLSFICYWQERWCLPFSSAVLLKDKPYFFSLCNADVLAEEIKKQSLHDPEWCAILIYSLISVSICLLNFLSE